MDLYPCDWSKTLDVLKRRAGFACLKANRRVVIHHTAKGGVSLVGLQLKVRWRGSVSL